MMLGKTSPSDLLHIADEGEHALRHTFEAHFYIAHYYLMKGQPKQARTHFQQCLDTGITDDDEYMAAKCDIKRIR